MAIATLSLACSFASGFSPIPTTTFGIRYSSSYSNDKEIESSSSSSLYAGFGGGGSSLSKKNKNKATDGKKGSPLKPKQQWNRYIKMEKEAEITVGVKLVDEDNDEWLAVGKIRSRESKYTTKAVFRQRSLIAEHAKRMYPLQVLPKKKLQWGYKEDEEGEGRWTVVDKSCEDTEEELDAKLVGFEGLPEPSGFYSDIDSGRVTSNPQSFRGESGGGGGITGSKKKGDGDG
eukprot:CAMPEP_0113311250 /NCGR_PEP_ID=MMETSP0010_2-20120614/8558_1 /TAXON_ID=216773 ORGANISM="Corethron hystrix, Strain 308" /NCGR_SAMPLE_ID=MMETSP0010_2 /ASSEMBLY_ACC=CAM_ASM_000155 /LENGTH=230 /DNA_ID=CAMNT_0000166843 /DNA_START=77 /DNA_END=766 /DNA_ORIENTATION=+ /assembly_acc=CAM_ASM_000155